MNKLIEYNENIRRGNVLRFPALYPYEKYVDILVVELFHDNGRFGLIVSSGYKAGHVLINLPNECELQDEIGISHKWLVKNWNKWIYSNNVEDIYIIDNYPVPDYPNYR